MADSACCEVGINGHLLAGHSIKRKARANLGHAACAFGDDHKVYNNEHAKDNQPHKDIAAHDKHGKARNDAARRIYACMPLTNNQFRRGHIQREPQQ